jgi:hypothetical protein
VVEIDRVPKLERPFDNGTGTRWQTVFDLVGWTSRSKRATATPEPSGEFWTDAEMHETMLKRRRRVDLDSEWRYHVLCVRRLSSTDRGLIYDNAATDSNDVPREGIGIGTGWVADQPIGLRVKPSLDGCPAVSNVTTDSAPFGASPRCRHPYKVSTGTPSIADKSVIVISRSISLIISFLPVVAES